MHIISRSDAIAAGLKRYYTAQPCKRGHTAERITTTSTCVECKSLQEKARYDSGIDAKYRKQRYQSDRERFISEQKRRDDMRRAEKIQYNRQWRSENSNYAAVYRKDNAGLYAFHAAKRRCRIAQATPGWVEWVEIRRLYDLAKAQHLVVDHIVPITHPLVCGLHCLDNLQLITAEENGQKSNSFTVG